jgi:hypothetical protein
MHRTHPQRADATPPPPLRPRSLSGRLRWRRSASLRWRRGAPWGHGGARRAAPRPWRQRRGQSTRRMVATTAALAGVGAQMGRVLRRHQWPLPRIQGQVAARRRCQPRLWTRFGPNLTLR